MYPRMIYFTEFYMQWAFNIEGIYYPSNVDTLDVL